LKVMTILGTRPEIIRLSRIIPKLDELCQHILVHTGQNFDPRLSDIFFAELKLRQPDHHITSYTTTISGHIAKAVTDVEMIIDKHRPDKVLILGDTNSGLSAIVAKRKGILVYHMEAGNRCYNDVVPEEVNRRIIDHCSDVLMPYTERSRANLLREGISSHRIFVTGNPIHEVIEYYSEQIDNSNILVTLDIKTKGYFLVTSHRAETVDDRDRLLALLEGLEHIGCEYNIPIIFSLHPRTRDKLNTHNIKPGEHIRLCEPLGLFDFVALELNAKCVITDSGTVQEECCIYQVPCITVRDVTERPETIECGSNILAGVLPDGMISALKVALMEKPCWVPPDGYLDKNVSAKVVKILLGRQ